MLYIWKTCPDKYIETEQPIDAEYWDGQIGETYEDYLDGKWVLLSNEQEAFHNENPNATLQEVWDTQLTPVPERTIEDAKREKIASIKAYDNSNAVNSFNIILDNNTISAWLTPDQRANYKNSVDAAKLVGLDELHPVFNGMQLTLQTSMAEMALAQIQLYADRCFIVTETHKAEVNTLDSIEAVDNYDITSDYPEKLTFTI